MEFRKLGELRAAATVNVLGSGQWAAFIGLLGLLTVALLAACGNEPLPTRVLLPIDPTPILNSAGPTAMPTTVPTVEPTVIPTAIPVTPTVGPTRGPVPASNIPLPTWEPSPTRVFQPSAVPEPTPIPTATPIPDPAIEIMSVAGEKLFAAGSVAFEINVALEILADGQARQIAVSYWGDYRPGWYSSAELTGAGVEPEGSIASRVISSEIFPRITHILDAGTQRWAAHQSRTPYFIDLAELFAPQGNRPPYLTLTGQEMRDGAAMHVISGKLLELELAGAPGKFDAVYRVGADDGLLREVQISGSLDLAEDTKLFGDIVGDSASLELTSRLFDHGKEIAIVTPTLALPLFEHEAVLLDDGRILVSGGLTGVANNDFIAPIPLGLTQVYDSKAGMWLLIEPLDSPGFLHSAVKLADGQVLAVGLGYGQGELIPGMAGVFDPGAGDWTPLSNSPLSRAIPNLVALNDGRILVAGGLDFSGSASPTSLAIPKEVEIYDPATGDWQQAAAMNQAFEYQRLFPLNDGRVIALRILGQDVDATAHAELYDPTADTWTIVGDHDPYYLPTDAVKLSDGRLLVIGALAQAARKSIRYSDHGGTLRKYVYLEDGRIFNVEEFAEQFPGAKLYDPDTGAWIPAEGMAQARIDYTLTLLPDGRVLAAGGKDLGSDPYKYVYLATTELFDPATGRWLPGPDLSEPRARHTATLLPDGSVLLAGGVGIAPENGQRAPLFSVDFVNPSTRPKAAEGEAG